MADTAIVQGKVDELLEKARLAMHERRYTEPSGDNALLYYRSAAAADASNGEAKDGLQRVASVLAGRFEDALSASRYEEAGQTLANFKAATPADARVAAFEQRLYAPRSTRALGDGNIDRAAAYVRQAQQSGSTSAEQIAKWRAEIARRTEDTKVTRLAGLVNDRIRDGRLVDGDDSAKFYMQQLQNAAPDQCHHPARGTRPDRSLPAQGARGGSCQEHGGTGSLAHRGACRGHEAGGTCRVPARPFQFAPEGCAGRDRPRPAARA